MQVIHKFIWDTTSDTIEVPFGKVVAVAWQTGALCVWVEYSGRPSAERQNLRIFGTGDPFKVPEGHVHLGTAVGDTLVFHLYGLRG